MTVGGVGKITIFAFYILVITNRKSHTVFRFLPQLMTLCDLEPSLHAIVKIWSSFEANCTERLQLAHHQRPNEAQGVSVLATYSL